MYCTLVVQQLASLRTLWGAQNKLIIEINAGTEVKKGLVMAKFGLTKVLSQTFLVSVMW